MEKFLLSFVLLGLLLISGFLLLILERGHSLYQGAGGCLMVGAMVCAAAVDIRLRSPRLRDPR